MTSTAVVALLNKRGVTLLAENEDWEYRQQIRSETSTRLYIVSRGKKGKMLGVWGCSCAGWKRWRRCKHLTNMMPTLQLIDREDPPQIGSR